MLRPQPRDVALEAGRGGVVVAVHGVTHSVDVHGADHFQLTVLQASVGDIHCTVHSSNTRKQFKYFQFFHFIRFLDLKCLICKILWILSEDGAKTRHRIREQILLKYMYYIN